MEFPISHELKDRILWIDGDSSVSSKVLAEYILNRKNVDKFFVTEVDAAVKKYNLYAEKTLGLKTEIKPLSFTYEIPKEYKMIELKQYFINKLVEHTKNSNLSESDILKRIKRIKQELELFKQYEIEDLIRCVIYIVDQFIANNIVWGTGRGSSCACYCLFLAQLHDVDSVEYNLDLNEFFR